MIRTTVELSASGPEFFPHDAEHRSGQAFTEAHASGEIATIGAYRGRPRPYGWASLRPSGDDFDLTTVDVAFFRRASALVEASKSAKADLIFLQINVAFQDQCNFEMSPEVVAELAAVGCTVTISCYPEA